MAGKQMGDKMAKKVVGDFLVIKTERRSGDY